MTESQETSTPSSPTTASMTFKVAGGGKLSDARFTEIVEVLEEFLRGLEPTDVWHVTLKVTSSA